MIVSKLIFGCLAAAFLLGVWLVRRGLRGVAVDDHVYCGKCSFDLHGIAKDAQCPECGSPALGPRRIGRWVRRPRLIFAGAAIILATPVAIWVVLSGPVSAGLRAIEPLWLLRKEVGFGWEAGDELEDRVRRGALNARDLASVIEESLENRHSENIEERIRWANVADAAHSAGRMDAAQTVRYFSESVDVQWVGGLIFMFKPAVNSSIFTFDASIEFAEVDGVAVTIAQPHTNVKIRHRPNMREGQTWIGVVPPDGSIGKVLVVRWRVRMRNADTDMPLAADWVHTERIELGQNVFGKVSGTQRAIDDALETKGRGK